jgi:hypothetical protein
MMSLQIYFPGELVWTVWTIWTVWQEWNILRLASKCTKHSASGSNVVFSFMHSSSPIYNKPHCCIFALDKFSYQFGQILFAIRKNTFCNLGKYILYFGEIHLHSTNMPYSHPHWCCIFGSKFWSGLLSRAETWINISEFVLSLILIFGISSPTDNWIIFCF